jgi:hypothetical protein
VARFSAGERASSLSVDGVMSAVAGVYNRALASPASSAPPDSGSFAGLAAASVVVPAGCETAVIRYFTTQGQEQSSYNPTATARITAKGPCSTSQGTVTIDVTVDDVQASSTTVLVNGTAQGSYEGYAVTATASNVRMTKQFCGAPSSGDISATLGGSSMTATVRFDGSLNAMAAYSWNGMTVSFNIAMKPC